MSGGRESKEGVVVAEGEFQGEAEGKMGKEEGMMQLKQKGMGCVGRGWEEGV